MQYAPPYIYTIKELKETHKLYDCNCKEWIFLNALYDGIREVIRLCLVEKHEREPDVSYNRRIKKLFGFGYSKSVVDIFNFYLFKKDSEKILMDLNDNVLFEEFINDSDLYGHNYDSTIMDIALYAIIQGHMGILIDKPTAQFKTLQEQIDARVYPYIAKYFPKAILDWAFNKDEYNRPFLSYLKLIDDNDQYRIWTRDSWEIWKIPQDQEGKQFGDEHKAEFIAGDFNPLEEIPFIWHYNLRSRNMGIGISDIHEVSRIDLSIIRNLSQAEQIIDYAAFPMMRKPMREAKPINSNAPQDNDEVGVESILEFDPEMPDSKPDWLPAEVKDPLEAIVSMIKEKIAEIYRASNIGGMTATEPSNQAISGVAKRIDFQMLNSKLVNKAINLERTENKILEFWLKWEGLWDQYKNEVSIVRDRVYDIDTIAEDLENALTSKTLIISKKFNILLQKQTARQMLPGANEKDLLEIDEEIEKNTAEIRDENYIDEANRTSDDMAIINQDNEYSNANNQETSLSGSQTEMNQDYQNTEKFRVEAN